MIAKDNFRSYLCQYPFERADVETGADVLVDWCATFGISKKWVSNQGLHFKNELVRKLRE